MPETGVEILAPASAAWNLLTDTSRWPQWGPSVSRVESAERFIGPGSSGRVQTIIGVRLPFRVTEFVAGHHWDWEVAGIPATGHRVESLGPDRCRVVFEVRLFGIRLTNLKYHVAQLPLFPQERRKALMVQAMDAVNNRYGDDTVTFASLMDTEEKGSHVISPAWRPDGIRCIDIK